ncbi:putative PurR-regulated permease PerM [Kribbella pratensis]|uniref:PurR-regulated permease PerM n=1 Tax=Kribbella pratensis TaxID=2512112 RepID=A0ABY2FQH7_9ACTN|nr:AI-2E family transporter [Kribbella pratensis]TDW95404.1 putative PurR-regulated permease PerM [Kribbella pratensis]
MGYQNAGARHRPCHEGGAVDAMMNQHDGPHVEATSTRPDYDPDVARAPVEQQQVEQHHEVPPYQHDGGAPVPGDGAPATARVEPMVVPRWVQAILIAAALFAVTVLARAAAPVLMVFLIAAVVALIVNPMVTLLERVRVPRGLAIGVVFVVFFGALSGAVALLVRPVAAQVSEFQADLPRLIASANASLANLQQWLDHRHIGIQLKRPGETALDTLQASILRGSGDVIAFTRDLVTLIAEAGFMLILILVIAIYMLLYGRQIGDLVRRWMPPGDGSVEDDYPTRVQRAVSGYVRGQFTFSFTMGLSAGVALWLFGAFGIFPAGKTYAVFFGVFYGLMELIPYLGPVLGAAPALLVALFQGQPWTALWLLILFVVLQQLEGHIVAPQVFGHSLRINPLVVLFALLLGGHLQGIIGALVALPLAAVARETALYLRRHLMMEPWGTPTAAVLRANPPGSSAVTAATPPTAKASPLSLAWAARASRQLRRRLPGRAGKSAEQESPDADAGSPPIPPSPPQ